MTEKTFLLKSRSPPGCHLEKRSQQIINMAFIFPPNNLKPYDVILQAHSKSQSPVNALSIAEILKEDLTAKIQVNSEYGRRGKEQKNIDLDITASQTEDKKTSAENSEDARQCGADTADGRELSNICSITRHAAASLDNVDAFLTLPKTISSNPYTAMLTGLVKAQYLPYQTEELGSYSSQSHNHEHYKMEARLTPSDKWMVISWGSKNNNMVFWDLQPGSPIPNLLPISAIYSLPTSLI